MRNVIVTGGSRGIGLGICRKLAAEGYRVIAIARTQNGQLAEAMREAEDRNPGSFQFVSFDLSAIDSIPDLVQTLHKGYGAIYGLVNNAGISFHGILSQMPTAQIEQLVRVNTTSPIVLTKYVVRTMMAGGGGRIVNIASIIASTGYSGLSVYGATKSSLTGFTRSLAREVGRMGITVNSVAPGFIDTDLTQSVQGEHRQKIEHRSALRRLAEIDDVVNAVEFLLSERAKNITGTVLTVDAGNTA
ncbi:MAG TPA: SDR family oxidoreductase [Acidobacteriaceae bacterium]|nr:SDR family oxidoreductase [Acidobacteriaceae bacterium]